MSDGLLLDSHVWVWITNGQLKSDAKLFDRLKLAASHEELFVSSVSLFEVANAARRGRVNLLRSLEDWFAENVGRPGMRIIELSEAIALETTTLPAEFHGDPFDRIIAATARVHGLSLVTHDDVLLRFGKQGLLRVQKASQKKD